MFPTGEAYFYSDSWQLIEERQGTFPSPERQFVWGLRYLDDLVLRDSTDYSPNRLYALQDANWNMTAIVDATGLVRERYSYDGYGQVTFLFSDFTPTTEGTGYSSNFDWETLFAGYRYLSSYSLYLVRNRVYGPLLGRWLTRDPADYIDTLNLYAYASGFPLGVTDPLGLSKVRIIYKIENKIVKVVYKNRKELARMLKAKLKPGNKCPDVRIFVQAKGKKKCNLPKHLAEEASPIGKAARHEANQAGHPGHYHPVRRRLAPHTGRYKTHRLLSREAAPSFEDGGLDFVYLDAGHAYEAIREDLRLWYPKVRSGGVFAGHDFLDGDRPEGEFGVRRAVLQFEREKGLRAAVTTEGEWPSWYLIKP